MEIYSKLRIYARVWVNNELMREQQKILAILPFNSVIISDVKRPRSNYNLVS